MAAAGSQALSKDALLGDLLARVSRSFVLTLHVLPGSLRDPIGMAYLFARAADTIADTDLIERPLRLRYLNEFRTQFLTDRPDWAAIGALREAVAPHQRDSSERELLEQLEACFRCYLAFPDGDRGRIRKLMGTLTNGMEMDLTAFPSDRAADVRALRTMADLDRYTYYVAGCVGEFWTEMACAHRPALAYWDVAHMAAQGVRFGKGLQITNILKDLPHDLQRGRCYLPLELLEPYGLTPHDLQNPANVAACRPVLSRLLRMAVDHLDQGWLYTLAIPRGELRLRLACMWPILFAGATLRRVASSPDWLNPRVTLKMPKREVYGIMGVTLLTAGCGYVGTALWGRLRKQVGAW